jgi:allophanate hydrolase
MPRRTFRFGVPEQLEFLGDRQAERLYQATVQRLEALGGQPVSLDFEPFLAAARLLYEGPWVAERYAAIQPFIESRPEALHPVTRAVIQPAVRATAVQAFQAQYQLQALKRRADVLLADLDLVLIPSAPTIYTIAEVEDDPIRLNSWLGLYTNFMNLLDYAAVAVPAGFDDRGLPFGVTLFGAAFSDQALAVYADRLHRAADLSLGATGRWSESPPLPEPVVAEPMLHLAVCGAHLSGLPLNHQLTQRGGRLLSATRTAPRYRLYALPGGPPHRPGLIRQAEGGAAIEVEVWELPEAGFGGFMQGIPSPLGIGSLELEDGSWVKGFICEGHAAAGARDITHLGGWRAFVAEDTPQR